MCALKAVLNKLVCALLPAYHCLRNISTSFLWKGIKGEHGHLVESAVSSVSTRIQIKRVEINTHDFTELLAELVCKLWHNLI